MSLFLHEQNKKLLWQTIQSSPFFNESEINWSWFQSTLQRIATNYQYEITSKELKQINRDTIAHMFREMKQIVEKKREQMYKFHSRPTAELHIPPAPSGPRNVPPTTSTNNLETIYTRNEGKRSEEFNQSFLQKQQEYSSAFVPRKPTEIDFRVDANDTPIQNIHELLERQKLEREKDLERVKSEVSVKSVSFHVDTIDDSRPETSFLPANVPLRPQAPLAPASVQMREESELLEANGPVREQSELADASDDSRSGNRETNRGDSWKAEKLLDSDDAEVTDSIGQLISPYVSYKDLCTTDSRPETSFHHANVPLRPQAELAPAPVHTETIVKFLEQFQDKFFARFDKLLTILEHKIPCNDPSMNDVYDDPSMNDVYDDPSMNDVYDDPSMNDVYDDPSMNDVYDDPSMNDVYDDPSMNDVYDDPSMNDVYDDVSCNGLGTFEEFYDHMSHWQHIMDMSNNAGNNDDIDVSMCGCMTIDVSLVPLFVMDYSYVIHRNPWESTEHVIENIIDHVNHHHEESGCE